MNDYQGQILIASAMATPQTFYTDLATWFAEQGFAVLTFDYRGAGELFPDNLEYPNITLEDWSLKDIATQLITRRTNSRTVIAMWWHTDYREKSSV